MTGLCHAGNAYRYKIDIVRVCEPDATRLPLLCSIANRAVHPVQFEHAFSFVTKGYEVFS